VNSCFAAIDTFQLVRALQPKKRLNMVGATITARGRGPPAACARYYFWLGNLLLPPSLTLPLKGGGAKLRGRGSAGRWERLLPVAEAGMC
jgi:hypothetical protein